jgi:hypothetical protein
MNVLIPTITTLFVIIAISTQTQAFSIENKNVTSDQTFNKLQVGGLQAISEANTSTTFTSASSDLKQVFKNQDVNASSIPSVNVTSTGEKRAAVLDYEGTLIPIIYEPIGDTSKNKTVARGIFEGDIIVKNAKIGADSKIAPDRFITTSKWTNGIIPVIIHPDTPNQDNIIDALSYVMENTPIIFRPVEVLNDRIVDPNYLVFFPSDNDKCYSGLGMEGGPQAIVVPSWCKTGSLVHEIGHTLGLWHEQTRCDRDANLEVVWNNIKPDWISQFNSICDPNNPSASPVSFGEYDLCSIMHYPRFGVASAIDPNQPILIPKVPVVGCDDIGQRNGYSPLDIEGINILYSQ